MEAEAGDLNQSMIVRWICNNGSSKCNIPAQPTLPNTQNTANPIIINNNRKKWHSKEREHSQYSDNCGFDCYSKFNLWTDVLRDPEDDCCMNFMGWQWWKLGWTMLMSLDPNHRCLFHWLVGDHTVVIEFASAPIRQHQWFTSKWLFDHCWFN